MHQSQLKAILAKSLFCLYSFCLSWTTPLTLSNDNSYDPHIDSNSVGMAMVVWTTMYEKDYEVQSIFFNGSSWDDIEIVSSSTKCLNPHCKIDKDGNCVAIWESIEENNRYVYSSKRPLNGTWETPTLIAPGQNVLESRLAVNANGLSIIAWINEKDSTIQISYCQYNERWSEPLTVVSTDSQKYNLKLKLDDIGTGFITWTNQDTETLSESHSTTSIDREWSDPSNLSEDTPVSSDSLSIDQTGSGCCSWLDVLNGYINVKMLAKGSWSNTPDVFEVKPLATKVTFKDDISYLAWVDASSGVLQCSKGSGGIWGTPQNIAEKVISPNPSQTIDSLGRAVIAWNGEVNNEYLVTYYDGSDIIGEPTQITDGGLNLELKFSASDNITFAVWNKIDEHGETIQVSLDTPR